MYCKNCGRQLKEGARFCDRCGQSVRQNNQPSEREMRRREAETLQEERLNRKKRIEYQEERESRKKQKKKSHKKANLILILVFAFMLIALFSALISYHMTVSDKKSADGEVIETAAPVSAQTAANQTAVTEQPAGKDDNSVEVSGDYEVFSINNISCPYPKGFAAKPASGSVRLNLTDSSGGAVMTVSVENNITAPATDLMREYASQIGGNITKSLADKDSYALTSTRDNIIYHRKCVISGTDIIYYDFQYASGSAKASEYEKNIEYIDEVMEGSSN